MKLLRQTNAPYQLCKPWVGPQGFVVKADHHGSNRSIAVFVGSFQPGKTPILVTQNSVNVCEYVWRDEFVLFSSCLQVFGGLGKGSMVSRLLITPTHSLC